MRSGTPLRRERKAHGVGVAAESGEELLAAFDCVQQMKAGDGAAGTIGLTAFERNYHRRAPRTVDDARGKNPDDAAMPPFSFDHDAAARMEAGVIPKPAFYLVEHVGFGLLTFAVQAVELGG